MPISEVNLIQQSKTKQTRYIFYDQSFRIDKNTNVTIYYHNAFIIGKDNSNISDLLTFFKNDIHRFRKLYVRQYSDNKVYSFTKHDLVVIQASNAQTISDNVYMVLNLPKKHPGDIIEIYYETEFTLPFLGFNFSLDEINICADKIQCSFEMAPGIKLAYQTINHEQIPTESFKNDNRILTFMWQSWIPQKNTKLFIKKNCAPGIIANSPNLFSDSQLDWKHFGDKYLEIIAHRFDDPILEEIAPNIVQDCSNELEKMQAIVYWCKKNIRYEQVYMEKGQFIPNTITDILNRKFGDCKDYSLAIYCLAREVGLKPNLALCFVGKDVEFGYNIPRAQFNHMIVYWNYHGQDYWFDGTNRSSQPGIFSDKLINQTAFVIDQNHSELKQMEELPNNSLKISADLEPYNNNLTGSLNISFNNQYASLFIYLTDILNDRELTNYIYQWICDYLNSNIIIRNVKWSSDTTTIEFTMDAVIPEPVINVNNVKYVSLKQIFPQYLSDEIYSIKPETIFYNPIYGHGNFNVDISKSKDAIINLSLSYDVLDGPFTPENAPIYYNQYLALIKVFSKPYILN